MNQTLELPAEVHRKLTQGAARHGMTVEALLMAFSELVGHSDHESEADRQRSGRIETLLDRFCGGQLNAADRAELNQLIDGDYQLANTRADKLISAKQGRAQNGHTPERKSDAAARPRKRTRR